jgi:hypothetical protein
MGAFILAILIFVAGVILAVFVAFAEGMASAPKYDNAPVVIFCIGVVLAVLVAASHWLPHIGW